MLIFIYKSDYCLCNLKEKAEQKAPKRPKSAFILFCETLDRGDALRQDFLRGAAAKWKQIAEQDKKVIKPRIIF